MAKRKRRKASPRKVATTRRTKSRSRRRRLSAGPLGGILSNPYVAGLAGAVGAGFIGAFLANPGKDGKPFIESPMVRTIAAVGGVFVVSRFIKAPALGLGAVIVGGYQLALENFGTNKATGKKILALGEGEAEVQYVPAELLNDGATLAESEVLSSGPYNATYYRHF